MRLLKFPRKQRKSIDRSSCSSQKRAAEATTDESLRSATNTPSWLNILKLRMNHQPRRASVETKSQIDSKSKPTSKDRRSAKHYRQMAYEETCRYLSGRDYAEHTDAQLEMFQTLMSNSGAAEATTKPQAPPPPPPPPPIYSGNNRGSVQFWSGFDPDFMPTAYPLMRSNARSQQPAKWGVLNLAASAALLEQPLKEFDSVRNKRPRFRLGPRILEEDQDGFGDRNSVSSTASSRSRSALDTIAPRYSFIAQDGKLVEREVRRWPRQKLPNLMVRYKVCEPYASNYGKRSVKRAASLAMRPILPSTRRIYERPIYMVPRSIVNDNKRRLLARHAMKDIREPGPGYAYRLPAKVTLQEGEQCKRYREHQAAKYVRETKERIEYEDQRKEKHRQAEASFSSGTISPSAPVS